MLSPSVVRARQLLRCGDYGERTADFVRRSNDIAPIALDTVRMSVRCDTTELAAELKQ